MPSWDSDQYRRFERERTQPALDLVRRIAVSNPRRAIDLGCGPGNSTAVLFERWPTSELHGLDSSPSMLDAARRDYPSLQWQLGDIATWTAADPFDIIFSNAALQWVPDHRSLLPRLMSSLKKDGALAFQVPADPQATPHRLMRDLAHSAAWRTHFRSEPREWQVENAAFYYDVLAPHSTRVELWITDYIHVLANANAIVDWYRGTGLRPWLDALPDDRTREQFLREYGATIATAYPPQHDGRVLFPFKRLFAIAYR